MGTRLRSWALACGALIGLTASGCAAADYFTAAQQTRTKNPHAAIEYIALCLKADPAHAEAIALMDELGKDIASDHAGKVKGFERSKKYASAVASCDRVVSTKDFIKTLPGKVEIFYDRNQRSEFAKLAAAQNYKRAERYSEQGVYKKAAIEYRRALGFVAGYKDAQAKYETAKSEALVKLAFVPFRGRGGGELVAEKFRKDLYTTIVDLNPEFLQVTLGKKPNTTQRITGVADVRFSDTGWRKARKTHTITKRRQVGVDEQGNNVYEEYDITANWTEFSRKTAVTLTLSYRILRRDGTAVDAGRATMKLHSSKRWASRFGGNTQLADYNDAIPEYVKSLPKRRVEPASRRTLTEALAGKWTKKGAPVHRFAHKIFRKYK